MSIVKPPHAEVGGCRIAFAVELPERNVGPAGGSWMVILDHSHIRADRPYVVDMLTVDAAGRASRTSTSRAMTAVEALEVCASRARRHGAK